MRTLRERWRMEWQATHALVWLAGVWIGSGIPEAAPLLVLIGLIVAVALKAFGPPDTIEVFEHTCACRRRFTFTFQRACSCPGYHTSVKVER